MAVQTQTPYIEYTANGSTTSFALGFDCESQEHLNVLVDNEKPEYSAWYLNNNTVVFRIAPKNNQKIIFKRETPLKRETNFQSYDNSFRPTPVNKDFDRIWWKLQELGVADWLLSLKIDKEIRDRIAADIYYYNLSSREMNEKISEIKEYIEALVNNITGKDFLPILDKYIKTWSGRTQEDKNKDVLSVKDFGNDNTKAFNDALSESNNIFVPKGEYELSDIVDTARFIGTSESIIKVNGSTYALSNPVIENRPLANRIMCGLQLGYTGYNNPFDPIFSGAERTPQGFSICDTPNGTRLFLMQKVAGGTRTPDERMRIVEFEYKDDGGDATVVSYSEPLSIGHQSLAAIYEDGKVWLYASSEVTQAQYDSGNTGKGYSLIEWKGNNTSQNDVKYVQLLGDIGSNHTLRRYQSASVSISTNTKYVCLIAADVKEGVYNDTGNYFLAFDRKKIESASDTLQVQPEFIVRLKTPAGEYVQYQQGTVFDGRYIYTMRGYLAPLHNAILQVYNLSGEIVREEVMPLGRGKYGMNRLLGNDTTSEFGHPSYPMSFEPEGMCMYKDKLIVLAVDFWQTASDVVSFMGYGNFACRTNEPVNDPSHAPSWVRTNLPANKGEWNGTVKYSIGTYVRRNKYLYEIKAFEGLKDEWLAGEAHNLVRSVASLQSGSNGVDVSNPFGQAMQFGGYNQQLSTYYRYGGFFNASAGRGCAFRVYADGFDVKTASSESYLSLIHLNDGSRNYSMIRGDTNANEGAGIDIFSNRDSVNPGQARVKTNSYEWVYTTAGAFRPGADTGYHLGTSSNGFEYGWLHNLRVKNTILPRENNVVDIGSAALKFKDIHATNGIIQTSDERYKQQFRSIFEAEKAAALEIKNSICLFKFNDSVSLKGDDARWHCGIKAQQVVSIMESHGLNPFSYGFICFDEWEAQEEELSSDGDVIKEAQEAGSRYAVRYNELVMFILATI